MYLIDGLTLIESLTCNYLKLQYIIGIVSVLLVLLCISFVIYSVYKRTIEYIASGCVLIIAIFMITLAITIDIKPMAVVRMDDVSALDFHYKYEIIDVVEYCCN